MREHELRELRRRLEATAVRPHANKVRIAKRANCSRAIGLASRPEIAAAETQKYRGPTGVRPFTLQRIKTLLDRIHVRSGRGVANGIDTARFSKPLEAQLARVAMTARRTIGRRIVTACG